MQRVRALIAALVLTSAPAALAAHPVLGTGHGVDHGTLLTHNLVQTSRTYAELGFTIWPIGSHDDGFESSTMYFPDGTYLEIYGVRDANEVAKGTEAHAVAGPDGLTWLTMDTSSLHDAVAFLRQRGHQLDEPFAVPEGPAWRYKLAGLQKDTLPGHWIYFIEYNPAQRAARRAQRPAEWRFKETHRNGAQGLRAVWVAVRKLADAEKQYQQSGFELGRRLELPHLKAVGREVLAGSGAIILVEPAAVDSPAAAFVQATPAAFMGLSLKVAALAQTKTILAEGGLTELRDYAGPFGRSTLVPADKAGGAWLEFFE